MGSPRKNYSGNFQHVKDQFQKAAGHLFEKEHHGRECNTQFSSTSFFVLFATSSRCSLFAAI